MPEMTTTIWRCSRCGATEEIKHDPKRPGDTQPKNWVRAYFTCPPRAAADSNGDLGDLCDPCGGLLVDFVHGKNLEQEMAKAMELARIEAWAQENVDLATRLRDTEATLRALRGTLREALGLEPEVASG